MPAEVVAAVLDRLHILGPQVGLGHAAIHLHRAHGGHQHHAIGRQAGFAALDVHELLGTQVSAEPGFGDHVVGQHIRPGTYSTPASDGCYYARLAGFSGQLSDIIVNNITDDRAVVTVSDGDIGFQSVRCGTWTRQ
jgi:hypothetical protein